MQGYVSLTRVATHQKTQQGLKHTWDAPKNERQVATHQKTQQGLKLCMRTVKWMIQLRRNASENPAGIETSHQEWHRFSSVWSQRIRKPSRD